MKIKISILILLFKCTSAFSQIGTTENLKTSKPLLIKSQKVSKEENSKVVYKSNAGYVKIFKITDSLFLLKAYDNSIYLNKTNIDELKEAAKLLKEAEKDDKVSLTTFRCEITKGKMLGVDVYWVELYKQKSGIDLSNLSPAEIYTLTKSSDINSVKNNNGEKVIEKAKLIQYEEKVERFGIANKELKKIMEIE